MSQEDGSGDEGDFIGERDTGPRNVVVPKTHQGFGFNVRGQVSEGGQLKSIGGQLYAPMQYISAVLEGGPAEKVGLKIGDRILKVNGETVEGADHQFVVQCIRQSGKQVTLDIVPVSEEEARRLEPDNTTASSSSNALEYYERRSVPVSVSSSEKKADDGGKEYVVFNVQLAGKTVAQRRYREFDALNTNLKRQFSDFVFPKLPGKWFLSLNDVQVDTRRRGLEDYMDKVCSAKVIYECDLMQDFLCLTSAGKASSAAPVPPADRGAKLSVKLPDSTTVTVTPEESARTPQVLHLVLEELHVGEKSLRMFALFVREDDGFARILMDNEFPYQIVEQKKVTLLLKKWVFSVPHEAAVTEDTVALSLFYQQTAADILAGSIDVGEYGSKLRTLKAQGEQREYLELARSIPDYGKVVFPHCSSDARKNGHVIMSVNMESLKLRACSVDGDSEAQEHSFKWNMISQYEADMEEQAFTFLCQREGKDPRWIRIYSPYYLYMERCVDRINEELLWKKPDSTTPNMSKGKARMAKVIDVPNNEL